MKYILLGITAWLLSSCSDQTTAPGGITGVQGSWGLQSFHMTGVSMESVVEPGLYTAEFTAEGRLSARADCNRCSSSYSAEGTRLEIGALACTRAYCGDESFFDDYVAALDSATSFERTSSSLLIRHPGGSLHFVSD